VCGMCCVCGMCVGGCVCDVCYVCGGCVCDMCCVVYVFGVGTMKKFSQGLLKTLQKKFGKKKLLALQL